MTFDLTPEQAAAVESDEPKYSVRAAAGSGKTRVITAKFLRCVLEHNISPDEILTITFTRAAATEMRSRIVKALRDKHRLDLAQVAETGPILTVHAFCDRILRENALAAGIDPEFEILDDATAAFARREALHRVILDHLDNLPEAMEYFLQFAGRRDGKRRGTMTERLESRVLLVMAKMRESGVPLSEWRDASATTAEVEGRFRRMILHALPAPIAAEVVDARGDFYTQLLAAAKGRRPAWFGRPDPDNETTGARLSCGLAQLAVAVWHEFDQHMVAEQRFDFASLESRAVEMLERSVATREAIGKQFRVMLVDESQDVNPLQYRLMDTLSVRQQMMVGDAQQAIYGFRGASAELFSRRAESLLTLQLNKNFRSTPGLLRFIDAVFARRWPEYAPMAPPVEAPPDPEDPFGSDMPLVTGVDWLRYPAASPRKTAEWVHTLVGQGEPPGDIAVLVRSMAQATEIRKGLRRLEVPARIVRGSETFYTRLVVRDLGNALRALARPSDDYALLSTLRSPLAEVSLDTAVLLAQSPGVHAQLADFRSPIAEDNERLAEFALWFNDLSRYADRLAAWECVARIFELTPYMTRIAAMTTGPQDVANARKLLQLAIEMPELGPTQFADYIGEIQSLRHKEGEATALDSSNDEVQILTAHSAKGLEFPVVVLDFSATPPPADSVYVDPINRVVADTTEEIKPMAYELLRYHRQQLHASEDERLIYVGMTRAQHRLSLVGLPPGRGKSLASHLSAWIEPMLDQVPGINVVDLNPPKTDVAEGDR